MNQLNQSWQALAIGIIVGLLVFIGVFAYERSKSDQAGLRNLSLVHELHKSAVQDYVLSAKSEISAMSNSPQVDQMMRKLQRSWDDLGQGREELLRDYFVYSGTDYGSADDDNYREEVSRYSEAHLSAHFWARRVVRHFDFHDLFFISPKGDIVYTVEKEIDFATNLRTGKYADSTLAQAFDLALRRPDRTIISETEDYAPSEGRRSYFAAHVLKDFNQQIIGVLAVQLKASVLTEIIAAPSILEITGGSYIADTSLQLISKSESLASPRIDANEITNEAINRAFEGFSGTEKIVGTNGKTSIAVYSPIDIGSVVWLLVTEQNVSEIRENTNYHNAVYFAVLMALLSAAIFYAFGMKQRNLSDTLQSET